MTSTTFRALQTLAVVAASLGALLSPGQPTVLAQPAPPVPPTPCHWQGTLLRPAERLGYANDTYQILITLNVAEDLANPDAQHGPQDTVILNSTYETTPQNLGNVNVGSPIEIGGYVREGGQCVADTLNVLSLEPGYEGFVRRPDICAPAGAELLDVYGKATLPLGCATSPAILRTTALEAFQNGVMLYLRGIYALQGGGATVGETALNGGIWSGARDAFRDPEPERVGLTPPAPNLVEPKRGFGKAWRERFGGPDGPFGWATEEEHAEPASWQTFQNGIVAVTRGGAGYILYYDNRVWEQQRR